MVESKCTHRLVLKNCIILVQKAFMWFKEYRDYKIDKPLVKEQVEPSHGIIGVEMHELNGWGTENHMRRPKKNGIIKKLFTFFCKWRHPLE